jgi:hypothetical protein
MSRAFKTGITKNVGLDSVTKDVNKTDDKFIDKSLNSFKNF